MQTKTIAHTLLSWIKEGLSFIGIPADLLEKLDVVIFLILIILASWLIGKLIRFIISRAIKRISKRKHITILDKLIEYNVLRKLSLIIPPMFVIAVLPFVLKSSPTLLDILERITWIYLTVILTTTLNTILISIGSATLNSEKNRNRPVKGVIQILQVGLLCIAVIVIISILIQKSPMNLITGLGAFAAILLLIFKDSLLGFVGGILLLENDMIHIGDWVEVPNTSINGVVIDISLTIVKVQNFDNTIVTIPPYSLISGSFINWKGMSDSGGRRIMRQFNLRLDYIKPCTSDFLERMKKFDAELAQYITIKQQQATAGKVTNTDNEEGLVNGTIETNAGLLRAYMCMYLRRHPFINKDLLIMVRTLAPGDTGLPLQVYCFSSNKVWEDYESIQAEIMEYFVSVMPQFELSPFQYPSGKEFTVSQLSEK